MNFIKDSILRCLSLLLLVFVFNADSLIAQVKVKGYYRKDGTYVRPHTRSSPKRKSDIQSYIPSQSQSSYERQILREIRQHEIEMIMENDCNYQVKKLKSELVELNNQIDGRLKVISIIRKELALIRPDIRNSLKYYLKRRKVKANFKLVEEYVYDFGQSVRRLDNSFYSDNNVCINSESKRIRNNIKDLLNDFDYFYEPMTNLDNSINEMSTIINGYEKSIFDGLILKLYYGEVMGNLVAIERDLIQVQNLIIALSRKV